MTDPDVLKIYPYWQYVHGFRRVPDEPRPEHKGWDGLILRADDPWWLTYYPPNGWKCGCGVRSVSKAKLKRLGKTGPDSAPGIELERRQDPGTGEWLDYPKGVDMGWAYAPGRTWADGLVPRELQRPLDRQMDLPTLEHLPAIRSFSKPLDRQPLSKDLTEQEYIKAFMDEFDASPDEPKRFRDVAGHLIMISDDLFKTPSGQSKLVRQIGDEVKLNTSRASSLTLLADALKDPDEIWLDWEWHRQKQQWVLKRRYLRALDNLAGLVVFDFSFSGWYGTTVYNAESGKKKKRKPNFNQLETWRHGALLFRRSSDESGQ